MYDEYLEDYTGVFERQGSTACVCLIVKSYVKG